MPEKRCSVAAKGGHAERAHAVLSPSAAHRWLRCPASIKLVERLRGEGRIEETTSAAAAEGTAAHEVAEAILTRYLQNRTIRPGDVGHWWQRHRDVLPEETASLGWDRISTEVGPYLEAVKDLDESGWTIMLERRVNPGNDSCTGTADCIALSPDGRELKVIDLKFGRGVPVSAKGNPQLRLYALGALRLFEALGSIETVTMVIVQPRLDSISQDTMSAADLVSWYRWIVEPAVVETASPEARFGPGEKACRWCPAAGMCTAQQRWVLAEGFDADAETLSPEELADGLSRMTAIKNWMSAAKLTATRMLDLDPAAVPGWGLKPGVKRRKIVGYPPPDAPADWVNPPTWKGLTELERANGKAEVADVLGDAITITEGEPRLVRTK